MPSIQKKEQNSLESVLQRIISSETLETQESIARGLRRAGFRGVDQSTISRTLKRLGVAKLREPHSGRLIYRWPPKKPMIAPPPQSVQALVQKVISNESLVIIHTHPGSAALVARYLDVNQRPGILGTIAGDDTVFVAPRSVTETRALHQEIKREFGLK